MSEQALSAAHFQMINIKDKQPTSRTAIAKGSIHVGKKAYDLIRTRQLPKGDVLILAEVAGINGAKSACQLIPLCHPLNLDHVSTHISLDSNTSSVIVYCSVSAYAKTGVEMEALAGVNSALLCIYDLTKMVEPALTISDIRLLYKKGGKNGDWIHPDGLPDEIKHLVPSAKNHTKYDGIKVGVIKISDRASRGVYDDSEEMKVTLQDTLSQLGMKVDHYHIIPNEPDQINRTIFSLIDTHAPQLIITTGGTGLSARDTTPETVTRICDRLIPGICELLRSQGSKFSKYSWLSRSIAGIIKNTIIITLPGKPKSVHESIEILHDILPHALASISLKNHDHVL